MVMVGPKKSINFLTLLPQELEYNYPPLEMGLMPCFWQKNRAEVTLHDLKGYGIKRHSSMAVTFEIIGHRTASPATRSLLLQRRHREAAEADLPREPQLGQIPAVWVF